VADHLQRKNPRRCRLFPAMTKRRVVAFFFFCLFYKMGPRLRERPCSRMQGIRKMAGRADCSQARNRPQHAVLASLLPPVSRPSATHFLDCICLLGGDQIVNTSTASSQRRDPDGAAVRLLHYHNLLLQVGQVVERSGYDFGGAARVAAAVWSGHTAPIRYSLPSQTACERAA